MFVRVRPLIEAEIEQTPTAESCVSILSEDSLTPQPPSAGATIAVDINSSHRRAFNFDHIASETTPQEDLFQLAVKPLILQALEG